MTTDDASTTWPPPVSSGDAGWYPDPGGEGQRYWNGSAWTAELARPIVVRGPQTPRAAGLPSTYAKGRPLGWLVYVALGTMVIGAIGPWATVGGESVKGTVGGTGDGVVVIGAAVICGILMMIHGMSPRRWLLTSILVLGSLTTLLCVIDLLRVLGTKADDGFESFAVSPGWGIIVALLGSGALAGTSIAMRPTRLG
jgi:hypothetical protein